MLKKLYSIVLVLGLTFTVAGLASADVNPSLNDAIGPFNITTGLMKGQTFVPVVPVELAKVATSGMPLEKPADMCRDYVVRSSSSGYNGIWTFAGAGIGYFGYQDLSIECPAPGTQDVQIVRFLGYDYDAPGTITMHGELWTADLSNPSCPVPGTLVAVGPEVTVDYPGGSGWLWVDCPLSPGVYDYNCIDGPFFACVRFTSDYTAPYFLVGSSDDLVEEDGLAPVMCKWYLEDPADPGVYEDMGDGFDDLQARDWYIFAWATTDAQNDCNVPGICGWDWKHCVWETMSFYNFTTPSSSGQRDAIWQMWEAAAPCTILQVDLYSIGVVAGDPGFRVAIYDDDNGYPGNELFYEEVPSAALNPGGWNSFNFTAQQPVIVSGVYYVYCSRASWAGDGDTLTIPLDDAPECLLAPTCYTGFTMGAADPGLEIYVCDLYPAGQEFELFAELFTCCAEPKTEEPCATIEPDVWFTHGHDYARTCATTMGVGEPCGIELAWRTPTTRSDKRFSQCAVVGGMVYTSDDQAVHCFDLATGAVQWTYYDATGIQTASSMRNTPTVTGGYLYGGGGTAQSFYKLDTLGALQWSRHYNSMGGGTADWLCGSMRFGVSVVLDDKVIFGDDGGCLWALEDATGNNHTGWGTNPIDLGGAIFHSPTYPGYGDFIYVATSTGDVFKVNYTDGTSTLIFSEPDAPDDGFLGGCSYDVTEDMIYLASNGDTPMRFKIDTDGVVQWQSAQGNVLYAPPTIGRKKVYFALDNPNTGVLIVDKTSGFLEYDFSADGIDMVPQPVTLTCDNYLFASDRAGVWALLDVDDFSVVWKRHMQSPLVWGTALAYHDLEDKNYAVMSIWLDINTGFANAAVMAWDLDAPLRPMMEMLVTEHEIPVPFQTTFVAGGGVADDVFTNWSGCADLTITEPLVAYNIDPATTVSLKSKVTRGDSKVAEETAERIAGSDYLSFFDSQGNLTKRGLMAGASAMDPEGLVLPESKIRLDRSKSSTTNLAASADLLRTSNIAMTVASPITGGTLVGLTWDYDGTGLERAVDHEYIEIINDDPDFYPELVGQGYYPGLDVFYIGGCLFETFEWMWFNGYEMWHQEAVFNQGRFGDGSGYGLDWGDGINDGMMYDGSIFIFQEGGTWIATWIYDNFERRILPNPAPLSGICGIDYADYVPIGQSVSIDWYSGGNCPPQYGVDYIDVLCDVSWVQYIDTLESEVTSYGTVITQVEISPYDYGHGYGDFKLRHFKIEERNNVAMDNMLFGMAHDWDPQPNNNCAYAIAPEAGGIVQWDSTSPSIGFGHLIMPAYTSAANSGLVDGAEAAYKMLWGADNVVRVYDGCLECSFDNDPNMIRFIENYNGTGMDDPVALGVGANGDKIEVVTFAKFDLPALGEHHAYCAVIGVDATTNDRAAIEDEIRSIAYRANKLAGFARGDVNDDGEVNAIDLAYLDAAVNGSGNPIFPWDGNGDVNNDTVTDPGDVAYLFAYLMGGPAPLGEWRFTFMP